MAPVAESDFGFWETPPTNTRYYRPEAIPLEGRELVFAASQTVVMGTHPEIPNVVVIGNLGNDLPEDYVAPALSHEEIHNAMNKLGFDEKAASATFLDRMGSAVTELDSSGLASEQTMASIFNQFRIRKALNRTR